MHTFCTSWCYIENNVCTRVTNCFSAHERIIFVFISPICEAITLEWAQKQFVTRVHTLFYFSHPYLMTKTTIFTHRPRVSLARSSFCWWRRDRLLMTSQWRDNCDAITWIMISNSLDIDFIHGDVYERSRKKLRYSSILPFSSVF